VGTSVSPCPTATARVALETTERGRTVVDRWVSLYAGGAGDTPRQ